MFQTSFRCVLTLKGRQKNMNAPFDGGSKLVDGLSPPPWVTPHLYNCTLLPPIVLSSCCCSSHWTGVKQHFLIPPVECHGTRKEEIGKEASQALQRGSQGTGLVWINAGFGLHSGIFFLLESSDFFHVLLIIILLQLLLIKSSVYPVPGSLFHIIYRSNSFTQIAKYFGHVKIENFASCISLQYTPVCSRHLLSLSVGTGIFTQLKFLFLSHTQSIHQFPILKLMPDLCCLIYCCN